MKEGKNTLKSISNDLIKKYYKEGNESSLNRKTEQLFWDSHKIIYRCVNVCFYNIEK